MKERNKAGIEGIVSAIHDGERFMVCTHIHPDGDAVGALLALTLMLERLGKTAVPYSKDPLPPYLAFLHGVSRIRHEWAQEDACDTAVLVDCGELRRVGAPLDEVVARVPMLLNIDHHIADAPFGHRYWVDPSASSTCEMLYDLSLRLSVPLDAAIASQLYVGLLTDTGGFRFSNTSHRVLEIAANLVHAGAQPHLIAQEVYDSMPPQRLYLLARVLSTVEFHANHRLATAEMTRKMFAETGTETSDSEGFINHLRSVSPVQMAMLFREEKDGIISVSMRSKGSVDVASLAHRFGGGGHRRAAAFRTEGPIETARARYTKEALNHMELSKAELREDRQAEYGSFAPRS